MLNSLLFLKTNSERFTALTDLTDEKWELIKRYFTLKINDCDTR